MSCCNGTNMCTDCKGGCCSQCEEWCDECSRGPLCQDCIFIINTALAVVADCFCYDCYIKRREK